MIEFGADFVKTGATEKIRTNSKVFGIVEFVKNSAKTDG